MDFPEPRQLCRGFSGTMTGMPCRLPCIWNFPDYVDPMVLAVAGLAVVGGVRSAVLSSKLRELNEEEEASTPSSSVTDTESSDTESSDVSIPYDAAARLAYKASGSKGDYESFKAKYEADAVAAVIAKRKA